MLSITPDQLTSAGGLRGQAAMTVTAERLDLAALTVAQLTEVAGDTADPDSRAARAELAGRRRAATAAKIRASSRDRHSAWEAAAYANYLAADTDTRGNLLSEAGRRTRREPWPMLWEGSEERARRYASEDLERFWDYVTPRPPSPGEYATAEREAAAEQHAREDMPSPGMLAAIAAARGEASESPAPVAAQEPGSIVRFNAALAWMTRTAEQAARSLERVNGGNQR